jgi:phospholipid/cholesterol/gamma-HCH transport system substrate-binding protein
MQNRPPYLKLGIFVFTGLLLLVAAIFLVSRQNYTFKKTYEVEALLDNAGGLRKGAPVRVAGIEKGVIEELILPANPKDKARIIMKMEGETRDLIGPGAIAKIKSQGFFGEKFIEIEIREQSEPSMSEAAKSADEKTRIVINGEEGDDFDKLIKKTSDAVDTLNQTAIQFQEIGRKINEGEGSIAQLLNDKKIYQDVSTTVDSVQSSSRKLGEIVSHIRGGKGTLGGLVYGRELSPEITATLSEARQSAQKLSSLLNDIETGKGTMGKLLKDEQMADDLRATLKSGRAAAANLEKLLGGIEKGEGPLGILAGGGDGKMNFGNTIKEAQKAVSQMNEVFTAAKTNSLVRGYFEDRGYFNTADLTDHYFSEPVNDSVVKEYTFSATELFDKKNYSAKLKNSEALYPVGVYLMSRKYSLVAIRVYLSDVGKEEENLQLSQARAYVIREYLTKNFPLDEKNIKIKGYGETESMPFPKERGAGFIRISVYEQSNSGLGASIK